MKPRLSTVCALLFRVVAAAPYILDEEKKKKHKIGHPGVEWGSPEFYYHVAVSVLLVLIGGVFAGYVSETTPLCLLNCA